MLRPLSTLPRSKRSTLELGKSGCRYVEDIENSENWSHSSNKILDPLPPTLSALDLWQEDIQDNHLTTLCKDLDDILDGGFRFGFITEICGAYGSGKTQICLQTSVTARLPVECGGLGAETLYIDTRNGFCPSRVRDIIGGCQKHFPNVVLNEIDVLKGIKVASPETLEDLLSTIHHLKSHLCIDSKRECKWNMMAEACKKRCFQLENMREIGKISHNCSTILIRVLILDSLSLPVQCAFGDGWQRTQFYSRIIDELQDIIARHKIAVIIVNELRSNLDADGKIVYDSAGGQIVAHRVHKRLVFARLNDETFAARILKSSTIPQISIKFRISVDGVEDRSKDPSS